MKEAMHPILKKLCSDLKSQANEADRQASLRFFKEEIRCYGLKTGPLRKIASSHWKEVKKLDKQEIFQLCEDLFRSDYMEEAGVAIVWLPKLADKFEHKDLVIFKKWIDRYINNWAKCDGFCNHTIGDFLEKYPDSIKEIKSWTASENRWMKRASAVSLILPARRGKYLREVFEIADSLLTDPDDMVQKGYGWMLKEASRVHEKEVFDYVVRNRIRMPRTALRYAVELMPLEKRKEAMKRE